VGELRCNQLKEKIFDWFQVWELEVEKIDPREPLLILCFDFSGIGMEGQVCVDWNFAGFALFFFRGCSL
jgi:hypothetical protein